MRKSIQFFVKIQRWVQKKLSFRTCQLARINPLDDLTWLLKNSVALVALEKSPDAFMPFICRRSAP